jgi:hypothetical protein
MPPPAEVSMRSSLSASWASCWAAIISCAWASICWMFGGWGIRLSASLGVVRHDLLRLEDGLEALDQLVLGDRRGVRGLRGLLVRKSYSSVSLRPVSVRSASLTSALHSVFSAVRRKNASLSLKAMVSLSPSRSHGQATPSAPPNTPRRVGDLVDHRAARSPGWREVELARGALWRPRRRWATSSGACSTSAVALAVGAARGAGRIGHGVQRALGRARPGRVIARAVGARRGAGGAGGRPRRAPAREAAGARAAAGQRGLQRSMPREQRLRRRVDLRLGGLDERELELGARLGPRLDGLERRGEQLEQPDDVAARELGRPAGPAGVAVGGHGDLGRDLAERADDEQVARVGLEVAQERAGVAAALAQLGRREQRPARVVRADRVERLEEQVGVGDAEHGEDVLERDRLPE